jgi:uncharacterized membrane-anchored protein
MPKRKRINMSKDKKTFIISVAEYYDKNQKDTKKLKVVCKDWIDAIIEHDKKFKNHYAVKSYFITDGKTISITQPKF